MSAVCAVSFDRYGRLYYLDPGEHRPAVGDRVLVPTDHGPEVAECVWPASEVAPTVAGLPVLVGRATEADLRRDRRNRSRRAEAKVATRRLVREHGLPMKIVAVDYLDADRRFIVYFTAPGRVDFRALVRDLARTLAARIDLRQLSARDEARVQGGIGPCGRDLCCSTFLADFEPVAVRMAKDQELPLNPLRISGACGRLLCCLKYEHPLYRNFRSSSPALGTAVDSPAGPGIVVGTNVPTDTVVVRITATGARCSCRRETVCPAAGRVRRRADPVPQLAGG
jgi:cell fate regulator YaaT (PSP1 superfamily)